MVTVSMEMRGSVILKNDLSPEEFVCHVIVHSLCWEARAQTLASILLEILRAPHNSLEVHSEILHLLTLKNDLCILMAVNRLFPGKGSFCPAFEFVAC